MSMAEYSNGAHGHSSRDFQNPRRSPYNKNKNWQEVVATLTQLKSRLDIAADPVNELKSAIKSNFVYWTNATDFAALDNLCKERPWKERLTTILPLMIDLAIKRNPLLESSDKLNCPALQSKELHVDSNYVATMLANAFFCAFPEREEKKFAPFNFLKLFGQTHGGTSKVEKLKCILTYFEVITNHRHAKYQVFYKRCVVDRLDFPDWACSNVPTGEMYAQPGSIEKDGVGMLQVDFANEFVGGGVLGNGAVMEEIRFATCPELIFGCYLAEKLQDNEVFYFKDFQQYSSYEGYGHSFKFKPFKKPNARVSLELVAMDALEFKSDVNIQFTSQFVNRELNKCYTAFHSRTSQNPKIASGNWGCGVFNGNLHLKFLIQLMASSLCGKKLFMFTFNDSGIAMEYNNITEIFKTHNVTVGTIYRMIEDYNKKHASSKSFFGKPPTLFEFIKSSISRGSTCGPIRSSRI